MPISSFTIDDPAACLTALTHNNTVFNNTVLNIQCLMVNMVNTSL